MSLVPSLQTGSALYEALPPLISWQSLKNCITRQSLVTSCFDGFVAPNATVNRNILVTKDQNILENYEKAMW